MRIALDTNVLWPIISDPSARGQALAIVLDNYNAQHDLSICAPVYAELVAAPGARVEAIDAMLARTGVAVDWSLTRDIWVAAGRVYADYAQRRRAETPPSEPRRILADFVIGAHALHRADALLTFNESDFRRNFPSLQLLVPTI